MRSHCYENVFSSEVEKSKASRHSEDHWSRRQEPYPDRPTAVRRGWLGARRLGPQLPRPLGGACPEPVEGLGVTAAWYFSSPRVPVAIPSIGILLLRP